MGKYGESILTFTQLLKGKPIDAVVSYMLADIQRLKKNLPFLKFAKGDGFTQDHWQDLFKLLDFPRGTDLKSTATLQVGSKGVE